MRAVVRPNCTVRSQLLACPQTPRPAGRHRVHNHGKAATNDSRSWSEVDRSHEKYVTERAVVHCALCLTFLSSGYAEQHAEFKEGTGDKPERLPSLQLLRGIRGVGKR